MTEDHVNPGTRLAWGIAAVVGKPVAAVVLFIGAWFSLKRSPSPLHVAE